MSFSLRNTFKKITGYIILFLFIISITGCGVLGNLAPTPTPAPSPSPTPLPTPVPKVKVKGIYISGWIAGTESRMEHLIKLTETTELNSFVIDIKDDRGQISYNSDIPLAVECGANVQMVKDLPALIKSLNDKKIYTIARIVCFKDPLISRKHPELAIKNKSGGIWHDAKGNSWLNPYNKGSWDYIISVSKATAKNGFREVQFDYIRFPTDGDVRSIDYGEIAKTTDKAAQIAAFLKYAKAELNRSGVYLAADVFGIIPVMKGDFEKIGQDLELIGQSVDYVCPMAYPSHYANAKQNGSGQDINGILFNKPDLMPHDVVYNTLVLCKQRISESGGTAIIRPYLQDFTAPWLGIGYYQKYSGEQVKQQIKAVTDAGLDEWLLWNPDVSYSEDGIPKR